MQYATPAIRVSVDVHITTGGSGIFEIRFVTLCPDLRLGGNYCRVGFESSQRGFEPARRNFDITVQQNGIFIVYLLDCLIVSFGEAVILIELNDPYGRELFFQHSNGGIRRTIVGNDYFR